MRVSVTPKLKIYHHSQHPKLPRKKDDAIEGESDEREIRNKQKPKIRERERER